MTPPKWNDDEALAEFVDDVFLEWEASDAYDEAMRDYDEADEEPPIRVTITAESIAESIELAAIVKAERGKFKALADIFERGDDLSPKAKAMIASKLRGTFKGKRGVLKRTITERDMDWKIDAAEEVDKIRAILKRHYPKEQGHTDRAIAIAVERVRKLAIQFPHLADEFGEVSHDKLDNYYRKSRHRRRWRRS